LRIIKVIIFEFSKQFILIENFFTIGTFIADLFIGDRRKMDLPRLQ